MWTYDHKTALEAHLMDYMDARHGPLTGNEFDHARRVLRALQYLIQRDRRPRKVASRRPTTATGVTRTW